MSGPQGNPTEDNRTLTEKMAQIWPQSFNSGWIPVDKRLPTHIYSVLGWIVGPDDLVFGLPFADIVIYNAKRQKWQCGGYGDNGGDADVEVTHWQNLPEAPK